jgi:hypothetical protein
MIDPNKAIRGVTLLKVIIHESHMDKNASMNTKLARLQPFIVTIPSNVSKYAQNIKVRIGQLNACNQVSSDIIKKAFGH